MSLVSYTAIRNSAVSQIKAIFEPWKELKVVAHPGKFDEAEIRRMAVQAPCVLTSLIKINDKDSDNEILSFVTWVMVRANNKDQLFDQVLNILSVLVPVLRGLNDDWSNGGAQNVEATNLYSSNTAEINFSLWAVSWDWAARQAVVITSEEAAGEVPPSIDDPVFDGGVLIPDQLQDFEGADGEMTFGDQVVEEEINNKE